MPLYESVAVATCRYYSTSEKEVGRKAKCEGQVELIAQVERIERQEIALALSKLV